MGDTQTTNPPKPSLKRKAFLAVQRALGASGIGDAYARRKKPNHAILLMYHSVCLEGAKPWVAPRNRMSIDRFERQLQRLAKSGRVVSPSRLVASIDGEPAPPGSIVLTFDDGYLDNLEIVAPLLAKYELPAVLYLATGYVADAAPQWADVIYGTIGHRRRDQLGLDGIGEWHLATEQARVSAIYAIGRAMIGGTREYREGLLEQIAEQLDAPAVPVRLTMDFDDARRCAEDYPSFELGVHSHDHLDLSAMNTDEAVKEVRRSMDVFRSELGREPEHFSFPYSRSTPDLIESLRGTGLRSAMTGEGVAPLDTLDPFDIHRLESPQSMSLFRYWSSGAHPTLTRSLFGRD